MTFFPKLIILAAAISIFGAGCGAPDVNLTQKEVVATPAEINTKAEDIIQGTLRAIRSGDATLPDSFRFKNAVILDVMYEEKAYQPLWSSNGNFTPRADSLFSMIDAARNFGLFPEDFYRTRLSRLHEQLLHDTSKENTLDASLWAYSDMMLSAAFIQAVKDLKVGRLLPDSVVNADTTLNAAYFNRQLEQFGMISNDSFAKTLEPAHTEYRDIRAALQKFLQTADFSKRTYVASKDSAELRKLLYLRLSEEDSSLNPAAHPDSLLLATAIRRYQQAHKIKTDGKFSTALVNRLNNTDEAKFVRVAINMDRFKQMPSLPAQYLWVNIPGFYLELRNADTVTITSKVCVGKPQTRTPLITSAISDMITYPKWTIPESIVKKEILPGLKRDPSYTTKKGYSLIDKDGNEVDPYSVTWSKYKDYIPYKVVQGSGDDNALGILKFNFPNKHSVYLHDTNQRYLFSRTNRALSHGCVRVQAWYELSKFILRNDSIHGKNATPVDSLDSWLSTKQKKYIPVRKPIPLYIRYFTCTAREGKLVFFDDIYAEDKKFSEQFKSNTTLL